VQRTVANGLNVRGIGLMRVHTWTRDVRRLVVGLLAVFLGSMIAAPVHAQQIWFGPRWPFRTLPGAVDWDAMFEPQADWAGTLSRINVFIIGNGNINFTPDAELVRQFQFFHQHNIKIALVIQSIGKTPACPGASEGYNTPDEGAQSTAKLKRLGLPLDYIRLDGPLWFGHYDTDRGACQYTPQQIADHVYLVVKEYLKNFPNVTIGEVESATNLDAHADWQEQYKAWRKAFEAVSGKPIAFLHAETHIADPSWPTALQSMARFAHTIGMPFGVIYNSGGPDNTDRDWIQHTTAFFEYAESGLGIIPDQAVLQTWGPRPSHVLPATSDSALSHLLVVYGLPRTRISLTQSGSLVAGQVLDTADKNRPLAQAHLTVEAAGLAHGNPLRSFTGTVPAAARSAIIGLRVNSECNCADTNDFQIGTFTYKETTGGAASVQVPPPKPSAGAQSDPGVTLKLEQIEGQSVLHLTTDHLGHYGFNSAPFAVTPNATFTFAVPIHNAPGMALSGTATLIWLDGNGHGLWRVNLAAPAEYTPIATLDTDHDGRFSVPRPKDEAGRPAPLRFHLAGTATYRGAYAVLP
jgi:hypothetical protein